MELKPVGQGLKPSSGGEGGAQEEALGLGVEEGG